MSEFPRSGGVVAESILQRRRPGTRVITGKYRVVACRNAPDRGGPVASEHPLGSVARRPADRSHLGRVDLGQHWLKAATIGYVAA